jgi:predicted nucleic acid-binding protein/GNAT superfamily N-acetyltransferase
MESKFINQEDPLLAKVIGLGKRNAQTLGLMPKDAYIELARKKCIVVTHEGDTLLGFCLFREVESKNRIGIIQLCVEATFRKMGISNLLLNKVRDRYTDVLDGMLVSCREDYTEACKLWDRYGFVIKKRVRSRSVRENWLLKYWYSFDKKDLFSSSEDSGDLKVVLDVNIIIKLRDQSENSEITQLLSDWLVDEVEYCYAKETLNEIHRDKNHERTQNTIHYLNLFRELTCNPSKSQQFLPELERLLPGKTINHISDRKQLAECKASNIHYFITMDDEIISNRDIIYETIGISILRPSEFILEIDELRNRRLYEPIRLQGTNYFVKRVDSNSLVDVIDIFLNKEYGEKKKQFQDLVFSITSNPKTASAKLVISSSDNPISFYGVADSSNSLDIKFLRLNEDAISNTLFTQILVEIVRESVAKEKHYITLSEQRLSVDQRMILSSSGFYFLENKWRKLTIKGLLSLENLRNNTIVNSHPDCLKTLNLINNSTEEIHRRKIALGFEKKLWPLKISDLEIPCQIIPIKFWASQLFDFISASELLFAAPPGLSWSKENVYYRSARPDVEIFPGRILWYASQQRRFARQKAIIGCSYLNNVIVGEAKQLYSTFRRFGVYEWREIIKLAKGNARGIIKVLQFSDTEVFEKPIDFNSVNNILIENGFRKQTFVSPVKVDNHVFNEIYKIGKV